LFSTDNGSIYGYLPSVSSIQFFGVLAKVAPRTGELADVHLHDGCAGATGPVHPSNERCFSSPWFNSASEHLANVAAELNSAQVDYISPSTTASNSGYTWRSARCCNLEPVFKLTDATAADSQSKAAFTSGIAFGVAGAAFIAVLQELPKEFPWSRLSGYASRLCRTLKRYWRRLQESLRVRYGPTGPDESD
jgi:hypothetical protein